MVPPDNNDFSLSTCSLSHSLSLSPVLPRLHCCPPEFPCVTVYILTTQCQLSCVLVCCLRKAAVFNTIRFFKKLRGSCQKGKTQNENNRTKRKRKNTTAATSGPKKGTNRKKRPTEEVKVRNAALSVAEVEERELQVKRCSEKVGVERGREDGGIVRTYSKHEKNNSSEKERERWCGGKEKVQV